MKDKSNGGSPKLFFKVTKMTEINVYIYGGSSRDNATEKITDKNKAVEINKEYSVDVDTGIFIVAFPNKNQNETELAFNYWIEAKKIP